MRMEVIHLNKFTTPMRLLFFRKGWLIGLDSQEEKSSLRFQAAKQRFILLLGGNDERILHWSQWWCTILHNPVL
jgi:hypothetical protein